ncbi:DMT family transporter [Desulfospira joergensenii]|uniref:DMT family transporter n=1 Tax=Desulfospira joergensenii TaxID=53329 RepID=UPI0003B4F7E6|nr:DMT family transporter [Desulfospira joergensenii]
MLSILLSLVACVGWGVADFIGGLKSRTLPTFTLLLISNISGISCLLLIVAAFSRNLPEDPNLIWSVPAGFVGLTAMYLLYRSLAIGVISILAPVSATGTILPVVWGIICGDTLSGLQLSGMAMAFAGTILAVMESGGETHRVKAAKGIHLALAAAVCIGFYFILMDRAAQNHPLWASMIMRCSTLVFLIPLMLINRTPLTVGKPHLPWVVIMGLVDTIAAFAFAAATREGMLSVVSILSSLYPAVTVFLSAVIVKEKLNKAQSFGVLLAISGVALISGF